MTMKGFRKPGEFCWINVLTARPAEARGFFGELLRWTFTEMEKIPGYAIKLDGHDIGGLWDIDHPNTPKDAQPVLAPVVKVESAATIAKRVAALGGSAREPMTVLDAGRMVVCTDPNGVQFDVWEPIEMQGTDVDSSRHGAPSWFENLTTNVDRAARFYAELFGWKPETMPIPGTPPSANATYTTLKLGDDMVGGMMAIGPQMGPLKPTWATYFTVDNPDETAKLATRLGAKLCMPVMDIPTVGRFCGITSPQGVTFYAIRFAPPAK
jgi:predicted enzyme related to lactoylglutathione lyase